MQTVSSVTYKKGNKARYAIWGIAGALVVALAVMFFDTLKVAGSMSVPSGYKIMVTDNNVGGSSDRVVYYVYDNKVLVEDVKKQTNESGVAERTMMIYDDVGANNLALDEGVMEEECAEGETCEQQSKALAKVKKALQRKVGREYVGM